jgi:hypothetical protein
VQDLRQTLIDFLVVAVPAVVFYFLGWVYLSSYLGLFGINISELNLDLPTILIYSASPVQIFLRAYWIQIAALALLTLMALIWLRRRVPSRSRQKWRVPTVTKWSVALLVAASSMLLVLIPIARWSAQRAADLAWTGHGVLIDVRTQGGTDDDWTANYRRCADRRGLELIFADGTAFYLLCRSLIDTEGGVVYQLRESALVSVRYVRRPF